MTVPDTDSLASYGGALQDYGGIAVIDTTTDRGADAMNRALTSAAGMTHTAIRAWVQFLANGTSAPTLTSHDAVWGNTAGVAPTPTRVGVGHYNVAWPATVADEIPAGKPGYIASHTVNLRAGWSNVLSLVTGYTVQVVPSANACDIYIFAAGALADPTVNVNVWLI